MENYSITINGKKLSYNISGKGRPVVLLHGYLETKELWDEIALKLSEKYSVICPDLPGQGESEPLFNQTIESMAMAVNGLLEYLNIGKVNLFGHSMGGYVTLVFAELFPDKPESFGLLHSHPFPDSPEKKEQRLQEIDLVKKGRREMIIKYSVPGYFAPGFASENEQIINKAIEQALKTTDQGMIACISAMKQRKEMLHVLKNSTLPKLWIIGRKDEFFPCSRAIEISRELKNTSFHILEKSGHVGMTEQSEETIEIISDFLKTNNFQAGTM